ncbi:MAG: hypothetical protein V7746_05965 [Halioglobus sp.]
MEKNSSGASTFSQVFKFFKPTPRSMSSRTAKKRAARATKMLADLPKPAQRKKTAGTKTRPFQAASITSNGSKCSCDAVKQIEGSRFLSREAPLLPLQDCTSPNCTCSYTRYRDRRGFNGDRRSIVSMAASQIRVQRQSKECISRSQTLGRRTSDVDELESLNNF